MASLREEDRRRESGSVPCTAEAVDGPTLGKFCRKDAYNSSSGFCVLRLCVNMAALVDGGRWASKANETQQDWCQDGPITKHLRRRGVSGCRSKKKGDQINGMCAEADERNNNRDRMAHP